MRYSIYILLVCICSCGNHHEEVDLSDFSGSWIVESEGITFCEEWDALSNAELRGIGFSIEAGDTTLNENLRIFRKEDNWVYEATVFNQNDSQPVEFPMTFDSLDTFTFENSQHDFPKKIIYSFTTADEMNVNVGNGSPDNEFNLSFQRND